MCLLFDELILKHLSNIQIMAIECVKCFIKKGTVCIYLFLSNVTWVHIVLQKLEEICLEKELENLWISKGTLWISCISILLNQCILKLYFNIQSVNEHSRRYILIYWLIKFIALILAPEEFLLLLIAIWNWFI